MHLKIFFLPIQVTGLYKTSDDKLVGAVSVFDASLLMNVQLPYTEIYFRVGFTKIVYKFSLVNGGQTLLLKDEKGQEYSLMPFINSGGVLKVGKRFPVSKKGGSTTFNHTILEIVVVTAYELEPADAENLFESPLITEFNLVTAES